GSMLDVSGGSVRYSDGWNTSTKLLGANGRIYDIGDAMHDQKDIALADGWTRHSDRWGITETLSFPPGRCRTASGKDYTEDRRAGSFDLYSGEALIIEGNLLGGVTIGERQIELGNLPTSGSLVIGGGTSPYVAWTPNDVIVSNDPTTLPEGFSVHDEVG